MLDSRSVSFALVTVSAIFGMHIGPLLAAPIATNQTEIVCGIHAHVVTVSPPTCACIDAYSPMRIQEGRMEECENVMSMLSEAGSTQGEFNRKQFGPVGEHHCVCILASHKDNQKEIWPSAMSYKDWRPRRQFNRDQAEREKIWATNGTGGLKEADRDILAKIYYESRSVFETGVGESTTIAIFTGVPRYTGVDCDPAWVHQVAQKAPPHYRLHWADIGPIGIWSLPNLQTKSKDQMAKWPFASFSALSSESAFDFYFVDGRFRMATFAACFLHASMHGRNPSEFRVGIHDYQQRHGNTDDPEYKNKPTGDDYLDTLEIGEVVEGYPLNPNARIGVFRRKPDVTNAQILAIWHKHQYMFT
eukprot:m.133595 g.133595  ORF g.133595 m.133595 type:complete len:360 (-) comp29684_c0_seq1:92-1171(-)